MSPRARIGWSSVPRAAGLQMVAFFSVALLLGGCGVDHVAGSAPASTFDRPASAPIDAVLSGTPFDVALATELSSETAVVGDSWAGLLVENVPLLNGGLIPAGSPVDGVVAISTPAGAGAEAVLQLGVRSITVNGRDEFITASSGAVHAKPGSNRRDRASRRTRREPRHARTAQSRGLAGAGDRDERFAGTSRGLVMLRDGTVLRFIVMQTVAMR